MLRSRQTGPEFDQLKAQFMAFKAQGAPPLDPPPGTPTASAAQQEWGRAAVEAFTNRKKDIGRRYAAAARNRSMDKRSPEFVALKAEWDAIKGAEPPPMLNPNPQAAAAPAAPALEQELFEVPYSAGLGMTRLRTKIQAVLERGTNEDKMQSSPHPVLMDQVFYHQEIKPLMCEWVLLWLHKARERGMGGMGHGRHGAWEAWGMGDECSG